MDGTPPFLIIMRHSARLDLTPEGQIKASEAQWTDREDRPWDPPIFDFNLPSNIAEAELADLSDTLVIYSSPFRRCLQTAGVVASKLKKNCIWVHPGLGEIMAKVRAEACDMPIVEGGNRVNGWYLLSRAEWLDVVSEASNGYVTSVVPIDKISGEIPVWSESYSESMERLATISSKLQEDHMTRGENVLLVTHGDALNATMQYFCGQLCAAYDVNYCGMLVFDSGESLVHFRGTKVLQM